MRGRKPDTQAGYEDALHDVPEAPDWLSPEAQDEWRRVTPVLVERGVLTEDNLATLESYCLSIGSVRRSQKQIAADGETVQTPTGIMRRHPAYQTLFQSQTEARRLAAELGLTPASRNKTGNKGGSQNDLFSGGVWSSMGVQ